MSANPRPPRPSMPLDPPAAQDADLRFEDAAVPAPHSATTLLTEDHDVLRQLFLDHAESVADPTAAVRRRGIVQTLCQRLVWHAALEEALFYPAASEALGDPARIHEAVGDHERIGLWIERLQAPALDDAAATVLVHALRATVLEHIEAEEDELFARLADTPVDLEALGLAMRERLRLWQAGAGPG